MDTCLYMKEIKRSLQISKKVVLYIMNLKMSDLDTSIFYSREGALVSGENRDKGRKKKKKEEKRRKKKKKEEKRR